jgi:hypothetical protein
MSFIQARKNHGRMLIKETHHWYLSSDVFPEYPMLVSCSGGTNDETG